MTAIRVLFVSVAAMGGISPPVVRADVTVHNPTRSAFIAHGMGARAAAMGGAFTALADDASAGYWNPGGLGQLRGMTGFAVHEFLGEGISLSQLSGAAEAGPGTVGAGLLLMNYGTYEMRDGTGAVQGTESLMDMAVMASFGIPNPAALRVGGWSGITLEFIRQSVGGSMVGASAGSVVPVAQGVKVGLSVRHLGSSSGGFSLPSRACAGVCWSPARRLLLSAEGGYGIAAKEAGALLGIEVTPHPNAALRAGYGWEPGSAVLGGLTGFAAGVGFKWEKIGIDYAFRPFGDLATGHRVALVYGGHRARAGTTGKETSAVRPSAREREPADAKRVYNQALGLYKARDYAGAEKLARTVLAGDAADWQAWQLLGNCLYAQKDKAGAISAWEKSLSLNPDNSVLRNWVSKVRGSQ